MAGREQPFLKKDYLEKLKAVSYWERNKMKEVIDEALGDYPRGRELNLYQMKEEGNEMKKLMVMLAMVLFVGIATSGRAENWIYMGEKSGEEQLWYNPQSVKKVDTGTFKLWIKSVRNKRSKYETARMMTRDDDREYVNALLNSAYQRSEIIINCTTLKWNYLSYAFYGKDGKEIFRQRYDGVQQEVVFQKKGWDIERGDLFNILVEKFCP